MTSPVLKSRYYLIALAAAYIKTFAGPKLVTLVMKKSNSLISTIPKFVCNLLELPQTDRLALLRSFELFLFDNLNCS